MPYFNKGGMTRNPSSGKLKAKRQKIYEEERIKKLEMSLKAFHDFLNNNYMLIEKLVVEEEDEDKDEKQKLIDSLDEVSDKDIEKIIKDYAAKKPIGF